MKRRSLLAALLAAPAVAVLPKLLPEPKPGKHVLDIQIATPATDYYQDFKRIPVKILDRTYYVYLYNA